MRKMGRGTMTLQPIMALVFTAITIPFALIVLGVELGIFALNSIGYFVGRAAYFLAYIGAFFVSLIYNITIGVSEYGINLIFEEFIGFLTTSIETLFNAFIGNPEDPAIGSINYILSNIGSVINGALGTIESGVNAIIGSQEEPDAGTINYIINGIDASIDSLVSTVENTINAIIGTPTDDPPVGSINYIFETAEDGLNAIIDPLQSLWDTAKSLGIPKGFEFGDFEKPWWMAQRMFDLLTSWIPSGLEYWYPFKGLPDLPTVDLGRISGISISSFDFGNIPSLSIGDVTIPTIGQISLDWSWTWEAPWDWRTPEDFIGVWSWTWLLNWRWGDYLVPYAEEVRDLLGL